MCNPADWQDKSDEGRSDLTSTSSRDQPPVPLSRFKFHVSLPVPREEARLGPRQISPPLPGEDLPIYAQIADQHLQPLLERLAGNLPVLHVDILRKRHAVRQRPRVALPGHGAQL